MWRLIFYTLFLVVAVCLGLYLEQDTGYVLIAYKHWTVETSLWFAVLCVLVVIFVLYYFIKFIGLLIRSHGHLISWYRQKQFVKAHTLTGAGLLALEEAQWQEAEALLLRGATSSSVPVVNYLNAARAAQQRQNYKNRDKHLRQAQAVAEGKECFAVEVTKVNLFFQQKDYEQASQLLERLNKEKAKHGHVLKLLQQVYLAQGDFAKLAKLLPSLQKRKVLAKGDYHALATLVYSKLFNLLDGDVTELKKLWCSLPKALQAEVKVAEAYVKRLLAFHEDSEAESIISVCMKLTFSEELAHAYMQLHSFNLVKRKKKALQWLAHYGENVALLNLLAELAYEEKNYNLVKDYAERALALQKNTTSFAYLLRASEALGEQHLAAQAKQALIDLSS